MYSKCELTSPFRLCCLEVIPANLNFFSISWWCYSQSFRLLQQAATYLYVIKSWDVESVSKQTSVRVCLNLIQFELNCKLVGLTLVRLWELCDALLSKRHYRAGTPKFGVWNAHSKVWCTLRVGIRSLRGSDKAKPKSLSFAWNIGLMIPFSSRFAILVHLASLSFALPCNRFRRASFVKHYDVYDMSPFTGCDYLDWYYRSFGKYDERFVIPDRNHFEWLHLTHSLLVPFERSFPIAARSIREPQIYFVCHSMSEYRPRCGFYIQISIKVTRGKIHYSWENYWSRESCQSISCW